MDKKYFPTTEEELLLKEIVDCAYRVHVNLGPGLLEKIYETCFCYELVKKKIKFISQVKMPIKYEGILFDEGFRIDVYVEDKIICELKSVNECKPIFDAQILTYMKLTNKHLGLLVNFNVTLIKSGIKRFIL